MSVLDDAVRQAHIIYMPIHDPVPPRRTAPPNEPLPSAYAWARYRRVMTWMTALALVCVAAALGWLRWASGTLRLHEAIATAAGVFLTVMIGTGLMSLVFLSAGSGHDAQAGERFERD